MRKKVSFNGPHGLLNSFSRVKAKKAKGNDHEILVLDRPANQRNHTI